MDDKESLASMQPELSTRDIRAHLEEVLRAEVSADSVSRVHSAVLAASNQELQKQSRNRASGADGFPMFPLCSSSVKYYRAPRIRKCPFHGFSNRT